MRRGASEHPPRPIGVEPGSPASPEWIRIDAARKDPGQFGHLYEANFELVYAFVARRVKRREEAEDLTSEVFRRALGAIRSFEPRGAPFSSWLLRIAANAVVDSVRRSKRPALSADGPEPSEPDRVDAAGRERLFRAVAELPPDQRRVIELRFAEERPIRAIADEMGRSEGAVKQLQLRALRGLRQRLRGDERTGRDDG